MPNNLVTTHFSLPSPFGRGTRVRAIHPLARTLRRNPSDAEKKLWRLLRAKQLRGHKFRRQFPIGPYIADFCCWDKRLIVEIDGGQHTDQVNKDRQRTTYLNNLGFRVLRFWNNEALIQTDAVLEKILDALGKPSPCPRISASGAPGAESSANGLPKEKKKEQTTNTSQ